MTVYPYELIGSQLKILGSTSKDLVGLEGRIIDECQNLLVIETGQGEEIKILKKAITRLRIQRDDKEVELLGEEIVGRSWDRIKG